MKQNESAKRSGSEPGPSPCGCSGSGTCMGCDGACPKCRGRESKKQQLQSPRDLLPTTTVMVWLIVLCVAA